MNLFAQFNIRNIDILMTYVNEKGQLKTTFYIVFLLIVLYCSNIVTGIITNYNCKKMWDKKLKHSLPKFKHSHLQKACTKEIHDRQSTREFSINFPKIMALQNPPQKTLLTRKLSIIALLQGLTGNTCQNQINCNQSLLNTAS